MSTANAKKSWMLRLGLVGGFFHLTMVILGATHAVHYSDDTKLGKLYGYYGESTGSIFGYAFFAPGVSSQLRATFDIEEKNGPTTHIELKDDSNREVDLRIGDIVEQFTHDDSEDMKFQRDLSASLSAAVLVRHKDAKSVTIQLERFTPISMEEFRSGSRADWIPMYSAKFQNSVEAAR